LRLVRSDRIFVVVKSLFVGLAAHAVLRRKSSARTGFKPAAVGPR